MAEKLPIRDSKSKEETGRHKPTAAGFIAQNPAKQDESSCGNNSKGHIHLGIGITTNGKKYCRYLRAPPNSPIRDSTGTTFQRKARVDIAPEENLKSPCMCISMYTDQKAKETSRTSDDATVTNEKIDNCNMHRSPKNTKTGSILENLVIYLTKLKVWKSDDSGSETEKEDSAAKRAAAWKGKETSKERRTSTTKQDLPTDVNLGKNENFKKQQALLTREDPGKNESVEEKQALPTKDNLGKKLMPEDTNSS
ncbi:unnamed protein product [Penicillium glandicola]